MTATRKPNRSVRRVFTHPGTGAGAALGYTADGTGHAVRFVGPWSEVPEVRRFDRPEDARRAWREIQARLSADGFVW